MTGWIIAIILYMLGMVYAGAVFAIARAILADEEERKRNAAEKVTIDAGTIAISYELLAEALRSLNKEAPTE